MYFSVNIAFYFLVPTAPPNVTAYNTSSSSFRVDWLPLTQGFVPGVLTGYRVRYRQPPNIFTGDVFVSIDQPTSWEYRGLDAQTQYCVQVLGETKHGSGPECYDGCVNVTTDVGGKKCSSNSYRNNYSLSKMIHVIGLVLKPNDLNTLKQHCTPKCMAKFFIQETKAL